MRSDFLVGAAAAAGIAVAGCGGGTSGTGGAAHHAAVPGAGSRPTQIYRVQMSGKVGTPPGAARGVGAAIIAFHGASRLCWRFAHLHGFTGATSAHVDAQTTGHRDQAVIVLSPGPRLRHEGCIPLSPTLYRSIVARPNGYSVSIQSKQYPQGAVRAQL